MATGVRIAEGGGDAVALGLAVQLLGNGLPLSWRGLHADVAVGGDTLSVHNDTHAALMPFRVEVAESHHVSAAGIEIAVLIELERLRCYATEEEKNKRTKRIITPHNIYSFSVFYLL